MLFNSYEFLFLFLPLSVAGFFLVGSRGHHRLAVAWLAGASLFFYGWWNPAYVWLILASIGVNYTLGLGLGSRPSQGGLLRRFLLTLGITFNLGLLGYYKYSNFFVDTACSLMGGTSHLAAITLPLAISFFTFQQIAFLVDTYKGHARVYDLLHYCLFVTFFPQLIAGPIVHHREMMPQFMRRSFLRLNSEHVAIGLTLFCMGLFKKVVLADGVAAYATPIFHAAEQGVSLSFFDAWAGALAYTFQLYFDFSGYCDMALGIARVFGIRLPLNFNSPYKARNMIEFWRRWHMTLSRFLRDYLYIPLGGNRHGRVRRYVNLMLTMLLCSLGRPARHLSRCQSCLENPHADSGPTHRPMVDCGPGARLHLCGRGGGLGPVSGRELHRGPAPVQRHGRAEGLRPA